MHNRESLLSHPEFQRAKTAFDIRYYQWAQDQARQEAYKDFPTLRLIKDDLVYKFLGIANSMEQRDRFPFLSALVKRAHREGVRLTGESITSQDQQFIDRYLNSDYYESAMGEKVLDATLKRSGDARMSRSGENAPFLPTINKQQLRELVIQKLEPILGIESEKAVDHLRYVTRIGPWSVLTLVDLHKKFVHLSYFHRVNIQGDLNLHFGVSPRQWFGIGGSSTDWKLRDDSEIGETTEALVILVRRFLDGARSILEGVPRVDVIC